MGVHVEGIPQPCWLKPLFLTIVNYCMPLQGGMDRSNGRSVHDAQKLKELIEIQELFEREGLPSEAAEALTNPGGDFNYSSLPMLAELITFEDLRDVKLQIGPARSLLRKLQPGGEIHNMLVITGRICKQVVQPPRRGGGESHTESSLSGRSSGQSGGGSVKTSILVTKSDKERASAVAEQLREQRRLSTLCGHQFRSLVEGISHAEEKGFIDEVVGETLREVNRRANKAKHNFPEIARPGLRIPPTPPPPPPPPRERQKFGDDGTSPWQKRQKRVDDRYCHPSDHRRCAGKLHCCRKCSSWACNVHTFWCQSCKVYCCQRCNDDSVAIAKRPEGRWQCATCHASAQDLLHAR